MKKQLILGLVIPFLLAGCATSNATSSKAPAPNSKAPEGRQILSELNFTDIDGNPRDASLLKGKVTLINVWGTYCGPCKEEMPALAYCHKKYSKTFSFQVLGLVIDVQNQDGSINPSMKTKADKLLNTATATYENVILTESFYPWINTVEYVPTSVLIDENGYALDEEIVGSLSATAWDKYINDACMEYCI